ncbi:MAG: FHA domain-containing protein, partial [Muribaculaceae bacterium]|nr:FHA domain-containing protein [Muribaculaceae bacterium]
SASHATLKKEGDHWIIADVGSRNGTAVNGKWCFSPLPFRKGDIVRIGNFYDFRAV